MIVKEFRGEIEQKLGKSIEYSRDCKTLSESIFEHTGRSISPTTLKRVFGLTSGQVKASRYTLDSLAVYVGYKDWYDLSPKEAEKIDKKASAHTASWDAFREFHHNLSRQILSKIKSYSGIPFETTVERQAITQFVSDFIESDVPATAIIGPGGVGKSTALAHTLDRLWLGENPVYKDDVVRLVKVKGFAQSLKEFESVKAFAEHVYSVTIKEEQSVVEALGIKPQGRIVLVLDGLDEIDGRSLLIDDTFRKLIEHIPSSSAISKFIITVRGATWQRLAQPYKNIELITSNWYEVSFKDIDHGHSNIPKLDPEEVVSIIKSYCALSQHNTQLLLSSLSSSDTLFDVIGFPFFLQIYLQSNIHDKQERCETVLDLIEYYVKQFIFDTQYGEEKLSLVNQLLKLTNYGLRGVECKKADLVLTGEFKKAYDALLSVGVFTESKRMSKYHTFSVYTSFVNVNLYDFFISMYWVEYYEGVSRRMIAEISEMYSKTDFRIEIIQWLILVALKDKKFKALSEIFTLPFYRHEYWRISEFLGFHLRRFSKEKQALLTAFSQDKQSRFYFYERFVDIDFLVIQHQFDLDIYLKHNMDASSQMSAISLQFLAKLLMLDKGGMQVCHQKLLAISDKEKGLHPIALGRKYAALLEYEFLVKGSVSEALIERVFEISSELPALKEDAASFPSFLFHVMEAFVFTGNHQEILDALIEVKSNYPLFDNAKSSGFYHVMGVYTAYALVEQGELDLAQSVLESVNVKTFGQKVKNFWKIEKLMVEALLLNKKERYVAEIPVLNEALELSRFFGFTLYEVKSLFAMGNAYGKLGEKVLGEEYCKKAEQLNGQNLQLSAVDSCGCSY